MYKVLYIGILLYPLRWQDYEARPGARRELDDAATNNKGLVLVLV